MERIWHFVDRCDRRVLRPAERGAKSRAAWRFNAGECSSSGKTDVT
jgi:hypothetical protein